MDGKIPPAQVAQCQHHLGHKYRSGMQQPNAGSTRARSAETRAKEEKEEKKEREKEKKDERKKCPWKDLNLRSSACKASFANHCATAHVLIGANRW